MTAADGSARTIGAARVSARVDYRHGTVQSIGSDPAASGLQALAGGSAFAGFRKALEQALPGESVTRSVRFQLLDDLPGALLVSGRALRVARVKIPLMSGRTPPVDVCSGWRSGGTAITGLTDFGPPLNRGPVAPALEPVDDPIAWHEIDPLPPQSTRRRRRLDVWEEGGVARVDGFFRDSHVDAEGLEEVVHEWTVQARFDPSTQRFLACEATVGALPYSECPSAAASANRLEGMGVDGLRQAVRKDLVGPPTCTHLNDTLRSLEDAGSLFEAARRAGPAANGELP